MTQQVHAWNSSQEVDLDGWLQDNGPIDQDTAVDWMSQIAAHTNTYFVKVASQRDITSVVSPGYTPLEQMNGRAIPQSDFYALGRSFIYLLTGRHPIDLEEDDNTGQLSWQDKTSEPLTWWSALPTTTLKIKETQRVS